MRRFDYCFLLDPSHPSNLIGRAMGIATLKERTSYRKERNPLVFRKLEDSAKILSVKNSNAIEGIVTSDRRLESLMRRDVEPIGHDEMEIAGYRDALTMIHENHAQMEVDETTILELHRIIMSYTGNEGGSYKRRDNSIIGVDENGNRYAHFEPTPAEETPKAMEQMILAYRDAEQNGVNPLLLIPCFILDFLSIHPFMDGNGRMSRLLTLLMYYKAGYDVGKYISLEERINSTNTQYYDALTTSSVNWHNDTNDYNPFISYYLNTLFMCYRGLDRCFVTEGDKKETKNNRVEAVVSNSLIPISKREIMSILPDVSQTTVEACLHRMIVDGRIERIGGNRNARYRRV